MKHFLIGMLMGACDMVPGVSGGTIALITGIYDTLITSIKKTLHLETFKQFFQGSRTHMRKRVNGNFLIVLFAGIFTSVLVFSHVLEGLLESSPEMVWGFFAGLVIASILVLLKKESIRSTKDVGFLLVGGLIAYGITLLTGGAAEVTWWYIILSASIAISAMILPGISGSFLLLVLGMYAPMLAAINEKNLAFLGLFAVGAVLGLALFSNLISYVLENYRKITMSVLIGFMIGSLPILWPRQNPDQSNNSEQTISVMPDAYEKEANFPLVMFLFLLGLVGGIKVFNKFDQTI